MQKASSQGKKKRGRYICCLVSSPPPPLNPSVDLVGGTKNTKRQQQLKTRQRQHTPLERTGEFLYIANETQIVFL